MTAITFIVRFVDNDDARRAETFNTLNEAVAFSNGCDDRGYRKVTVERVGHDSRIIMGLL